MYPEVILAERDLGNLKNQPYTMKQFMKTLAILATFVGFACADEASVATTQTNDVLLAAATTDSAQPNARTLNPSFRTQLQALGLESGPATLAAGCQFYTYDDGSVLDISSSNLDRQIAYGEDGVELLAEKFERVGLMPKSLQALVAKRFAAKSKLKG